MVRGTGPTARTKKSGDAATNGSKPVSTRKKKTAPKSKTPTPPPTKYRVRKSVVEQLDAALQPSTSGKIIIPGRTTTHIGSVEQLEMELDSEVDELERESSDLDLGLDDHEVIELSDDEGEVATGVDREARLPSPPPTDSKKPKVKGKGKQVQERV